MNAALIAIGIQKRAVDSCLNSGATSPTNALSKRELAIDDGIAIDKLYDGKVLRKTDDDRVWLDEGEWADYTDGRTGKVILGVTITALFVTAVLVTRAVLVNMT